VFFLVFLGFFRWVFLGGFFWLGFLLPTLLLEAQKIEPSTLTMEACRLKMELLRVYRPKVADSHHVDDEQDIDQDSDPHSSEKLDPDPH
jgi:hypothetical protein